MPTTPFSHLHPPAVTIRNTPTTPFSCIMPLHDFSSAVTVENTTTTITTLTTDMPPPALPLALLFSFGIIGALFLLMLILMGVTIGCCIVKKKLSEQEMAANGVTQLEASHQVVVNANVERSVEHTVTPHYSQVVKLAKKNQIDGRKSSSPPPLPPSVTSSPPPPLPPPPVLETPSPQPSFKPQEIVSYNSDIPKTFIPYAPPPPVSGLVNNDKGNTEESPYSIPVDSLADYDEVDSFDDSSLPGTRRKPSRTLSLQSYHTNSNYQSPSDDDSYYDTVESIQEDELPALSSSLQLNHSHGHYQSPRRRPGRYSHGNNPGYTFEPTYFEALEPSMLRSSVGSSLGNETPLPYAPIYDCPRNIKRCAQPLEISCHNIMEIEDLGTGRFGPIVLAATVNLTLKDLKLGDNADKNRSFLVAVKKQRKDADAATKTAFKEEIRFLSKLKHANVIRLLGVC